MNNDAWQPATPLGSCFNADGYYGDDIGTAIIASRDVNDIKFELKIFTLVHVGRIVHHSKYVMKLAELFL